MENCVPAGLQLQSITISLKPLTIKLKTLDLLVLTASFEKDCVTETFFDHTNLKVAGYVANTLIQYIGKRIVFWENQGGGVAYCFECGGAGVFGHSDFVEEAINAKSKEQS